LSQVLIIDCDSTINIETGETIKGAPDPELIADFFKKKGWEFTIYSSHSNDADKGHRYRIVAVTDRPYNKGELIATLASIFKELHAEGIMLKNVHENINWSLAWYLPRKDASNETPFIFIQNEGAPVPVSDALKLTIIQNKSSPKVPVSILIVESQSIINT